MKRTKKLVSILPCMALTLAMAVTIVGCNGSNSEKTSDVATEINAEGGVVGEGAKEFDFTVVDVEGKETEFEVHTDKEMVGEALEELDLIAGEEGDYGLYVKTVNGITLDYDKDGKYWAFYINGEYASSGVDVTPITEGESYSFQAE